MPDKAWKAWEREVAKDLGGVRTGPTGTDTPDVTGVALIAPECKYQGTLAFKEVDMQQARDNAAKVGLIPVVFLKEKNNLRRAVRMDYADFLTIYRLATGAQLEDSSARASMTEGEPVG